MDCSGITLPPSRTLKDFVVPTMQYGSNDLLCSKSNIQTVVQKAHPILLSIFLARGAASGMTASPRLNHRNADFQKIVSPSEKDGTIQPSLLQTCLKPGTGDKFDEMSSLTVLMYRQVSVASDKWNVQSTKSIRTSFDVRLEGDSELAECYLENIEAGDFDAPTFHRLLNIFGYKWMKNDDKGGIVERNDESNPTDFDLSHFFGMFTDIQLHNKAGWDAFLAKFDLGSIYAFDDTIPTAWVDGKLSEDEIHAAKMLRNCRQFSDLVNMLMPGRFGIGDGNHRGVLEALLLLETYDITRVVPLKSNPVSVDGRFVLSNHSTNQIYVPQKFRLGSLNDAEGKRLPISDQLTAFCTAGDVLTTAGNRSISTTWKEIHDKVCEIQLPMLQARIAETGPIWSYKNAWAPGITIEKVTKPTLEMTLECVFRAMESPSARQFVTNGGVADFEKLKKDIKASFLSVKTAMLNFTNHLGKAKHKLVPRDLAMYLHLLRLSCFNIEDMLALKNLLGYPESQYEQRNASCKIDFRNLDFVRDMLVECQGVFNHLRQKTSVEKYIKVKLNQAQKDPLFVQSYFGPSSDENGLPLIYEKGSKEDNKLETYKRKYKHFVRKGKFPIENDKVQSVHLPNVEMAYLKGVKKKKGVLSLSTLNLQKSTLDHRVEKACEITVYTNCIKAIVKFGLDPVIPVKDENEESKRNGALIDTINENP